MFTLSGDFESSDPMDINSFMEASRKYKEYLDSNKDSFSQTGYNFALKHWSQNSEDRESLHDSWLEKLEINERIIGGDKRVDIYLKLLGPFHDKILSVNYSQVKSYCMSHSSCSDGHGDFYRGEVRLSENKGIIHEIEWRSGDRWVVECSDIRYAWSNVDRKTN